MLVDLLLSPPGYRKLTVGADGLQSSYLPTQFLQVFIRDLGRRDIKIGELCFDLQYLNNLVTGPASEQGQLTNGTDFINCLGTQLVNNVGIQSLVVVHSTIDSLSAFFEGLKEQKARIDGMDEAIRVKEPGLRSL